MATYVNNLRLKEIATGDESGTWGTSTNTNLELIGEALGIGTEAITTNANTHTTTVADGSSDAGRAIYLKYTGALDSDCTITIGPNTMKRVHIIENATTDSGSSGPYNIIIKQGSGSTVTIANGKVAVVQLDGAGSGAAVLDAFTDLQVTDSLSVNGTTLTIGDATAEDTKLVFDGNAQDYYIGLDDSADDLVIGLGSAVGTTPAIEIDENQDIKFAQSIGVGQAASSTTGDIRAQTMSLLGTTPTLTIGDAGAEDTKIVFDGNAQDFYVGLDDSADDLVIGLGSTVGTTPAMSVDENQLATFHAGVTLTGTTPTLTIGDAGAEDTKIVFDGNAQDFYIGLDDSADDLVIGVGSAVGTTPAIIVNESRQVGIGVAPTHAFNLETTGAGEARFRSSDNDMSLQISSDADETHDSILEFTSGTSGRGRIVYDHNTTAASQKMNFVVGDVGTTAMTITGDGHVGVGTSTTNKIFNISDPDQGGETIKLHFEASSSSDNFAIFSYDRTNSHYTNMSLGQNAIFIQGSNTAVGMGTTSPNAVKLHVGDTAHNDLISGTQLLVSGTSAGAIAIGMVNGNGTGVLNIVMGTTSDGNKGEIAYNLNSNYMQFNTNGSERFRVDSNGRLNLGAVAHSADINQAILNCFINSSTIPVCRFAQGSTTTTVPVIRCRHENSSNGFYIDFRTDENATTGTIKDVSGTMTYASASDSRLKNNVETIPEGLTEVLAMNPVKFTWDEKKGGNESRGFLAQELNNQYSWAVQEGGDDPYTDPWQADYGKLTPVLVKAVQELKAELDAAKARITTLESA